MRKLIRLTLVLAGVIAVAATAGSSSAGSKLTRSAPTFSAQVTNPYFPLTPGTTLVYRGVKDGRAARDLVTPVSATKTIKGAPCRVVRDRLYLNGRLALDRLR